MYPLSVAARCTGAVCLPVVIVLLCVRPMWLKQLTQRLMTLLGRIGRRRRFFIIGAATGTFLLNAAISHFSMWPIPSVHDEFAYVLTGETFASGRFTNPTHPFADHFASWHIIQSPSYQAKYPPGQGVALAVGNLISGYPIVGVWLSLSLAMAATVWAMFQWLPNRWAVYSSLLILFNPHIHLRWGQSFWGGAIALGGGALLVGALGRLRRRGDMATGVAAGLGLAILAASRPFEGLLMAIPISLFACWVVLCRRDRSIAVVALSGIIIALSGGLLLAKYNLAVTGNWHKFPYRVWSEQQGDALDRAITPSVIPLKHVSKVTPNEEAAPAGDSSDWRVRETGRILSERGDDAFNFNRTKLYQLNEFYLQTILRLPLLALPWICLCRWRAVLVVAIGMVVAGSCTHLSAGHPHYVAGLAVAMMLVVTAGLRRIEITRIRRTRFGRGLSVLILLCWVTMSTLSFAADLVERPREPRLDWAQRRHTIETLHSNRTIQHVFFVRYTPDHSIHQEWVYNGANIDQQRVIWANDLGDRKNGELIRYLMNQREKTGFSTVQGMLLTVGDDPVDVDIDDRW